MNEKALSALEIYREKVASGEIEATPRKTLEERFAEKPTVGMAVKLFCKHCMGDASTYKTDIKNCSSKVCPLHQFRPYK